MVEREKLLMQLGKRCIIPQKVEPQPYEFPLKNIFLQNKLSDGQLKLNPLFQNSDFKTSIPLTGRSPRSTQPSRSKKDEQTSIGNITTPNKNKEGVLSWLNAALILGVNIKKDNKKPCLRKSKSFVNFKIRTNRTPYPNRHNINTDFHQMRNSNLPNLYRNKENQGKKLVARYFSKTPTNDRKNHILYEKLENPICKGHAIIKPGEISKKRNIKILDANDENFINPRMSIIKRLLEKKLKQPLIIEDVIKIEKLRFNEKRESSINLLMKKSYTPTLKNSSRLQKQENLFDFPRRDQGIQAKTSRQNLLSHGINIDSLIVHVSSSRNSVNNRIKTTNFVDKNQRVFKGNEEKSTRFQDISPWEY